MNGINVGVVGAGGYVGGELCRLLLGHSSIGTIFPIGRDDATFECDHQNLLGCGLRYHNLDNILSREDMDLFFLCAPTGVAMELVPVLNAKSLRIIDLSADFRFIDSEKFNHAHDKEHLSPHLLQHAVYGLSEFYREDIRSARIVANPGCYVMAILLGISPLLKKSIIEHANTIHITAVNGTTGASNKPKKDTMHAIAANNVLAYNLDGHRHTAELKDQIYKLYGWEPTIDFSTAHGPFPRGIHAQISIPLGKNHEKLNRNMLIEIFREFYTTDRQNLFVKINAFPRTGGKNDKDYAIYPSVARVAGSNFCHIGVDYDEDSNVIRIVSVLDNLVKGAAGSAIQNMNIMFGFEESAGLMTYGL